MSNGSLCNRLVCVVALLLLTLRAHPAQSQELSNIDPVEKWAWGTNAGWLNLRATDGGVRVYPDHLEGWAWGENVGWIRLGSNTIPGPHTYSNGSPDDYGVNHDGAGNLSGYAWGSNIGWINFAPSHGGVTIDLASGRFDGYAWAENVGWISFRGTGTVAYNVVVGRLLAIAIPVLSGLGIILLAALLAGVGVFAMRRVPARLRSHLAADAEE